MSDNVSARDLGAYLGVSDRSVRELAARGAIERTARGRYDLADSVRRYCTHLREVAAGRGGEGAVLDLTQERARLAREQADAQELKNRTSRGELLPADAVEREWSDILQRVRSALLSITGRVRQQISTMDTAQATILDREIRDALTALADDRDDALPRAGVPPAATEDATFLLD